MNKIFTLLILLSLAVGTDESLASQGNLAGEGSVTRAAETANGGAVPKGFADLVVTASFKTHRPGVYSAKDPHGTPEYQLQVSVGGQAVLLEGESQAENLSGELSDPERGDGVRYRFSKLVRLPAGGHRVVVSLPAENISIATKLTLKEGAENRLVLAPVYGRSMEKKRPSASRTTSFRQGIRTLQATFNGRPI